MRVLIRICLTSLFLALSLTSSLQASYYDGNQSLLFQASYTDLGANWRIATGEEVDALLYVSANPTSLHPSSFNQNIADAILGLGGQGAAPVLSCDTSFGGTCEELQVICETFAIPQCGSIQLTGGEYTLASVAYNEDGFGTSNILDMYLLDGTYTQLNGEWTVNPFVLAAPIGAWCEADCDFAKLYVSEVPLPAGLPLMASALLGLLGVRKLR